MAFEKFGQEEKEMDWNGVLENDPQEFVLAPAGDYDFTVVNLERKRYNGGAKIPACNQAALTLQVATPDGQKANIFHNLYLHTRCEGLLAAFFIGIGQKKHGEPLRMDWSKVVGATGRCKVGIREYQGKQHNTIVRIYDPSKTNAGSQAPVAKGFTPGKF